MSPVSPVLKAYRVAPGEAFRASWKLINKATIPWPTGVRIEFCGSTNSTADFSPRSTKCTELTEPLMPGEEAKFSVEMEAPKREGEYVSYWELVTPGGRPFGSRLRCVTFVEKGAGRWGKVEEDAVKALPPAVSSVSDV